MVPFDPLFRGIVELLCLHQIPPIYLEAQPNIARQLGQNFCECAFEQNFIVVCFHERVQKSLNFRLATHLLSFLFRNFSKVLVRNQMGLYVVDNLAPIVHRLFNRVLSKSEDLLDHGMIDVFLRDELGWILRCQ